MERSVAERVTRASTPATIEADLECLWREVANQAPVTRTIMSNLMVFRACLQDESLSLESSAGQVPLDEVARQHPSRVILLLHQGDPAQLQTPVAAWVGVLLFGSADARHAIEQITIRSVCAERSLPSIVRRLVLGDLPTSVWWTEDLSTTPPFTALVAMGRQFVYDSHEWRDVPAGLTRIAGLIDGPEKTDFADLNWTRLAPLRRAIQHGLRSLTLDARRSSAITVHVRHHPREAAKAWLLAGWLASQIDPGERDAQVVTPEPHGDEAPLLKVSIEAGPGWRLSADMEETRVVAVEPSTDVPFTLTVPPDRIADAVAAALRSLGGDAALAAAIRSAARRLSSAA